MVRNTTGGGNAKKQARKFQTAPAKRTNEVRKAEHNLEMYAIVESVHGNGLSVFTHTGHTLWCRVPGKFKGRNKRSNWFEKGTWVLVGLYEWSNNKEPDSCELLFVYEKPDIEQLRNMPDVDLRQILAKQSQTQLNGIPEDIDNQIIFSDNIISSDKMFASNTDNSVAVVNFSADEEVLYDDL